METIKVSYKCFWDSFDAKWFFSPLYEKYNVIEVDAYKERCDILFCSTYSRLKIEEIVENPIIVNYNGEHVDNRSLNIDISDYTIGFYKDTDTNLFLPLWQMRQNAIKKYRLEDRLSIKKDKFCLFLASESFKNRNRTFLILNAHKKVDSRGRCLNNAKIIPFGDYIEPRRYKFNLCFENTVSSGNFSYITEKIINAFAYNTVPIYLGAEDVGKYFNEKAFINCYGMSDKEILKKVKEVDENDELYNSMLSENPFVEDINYEQYWKNRFITFIKKILNKK